MDNLVIKVVPAKNREIENIFRVIVSPYHNSEVEKAYKIYHEKLKRMEEAIKLTNFWTRETAKETMKCAIQTHSASEYVMDFVKSQGG